MLHGMYALLVIDDTVYSNLDDYTTVLICRQQPPNHRLLKRSPDFRPFCQLL